MDYSTESDHNHRPVTDQHRCIWMSAGILSYQLCERQFDCDNCPLDQALRMHFTRRDDSHREAPTDSVTFRTHDPYYYSTRHCWVKEIGTTLVSVGIEPTLASVLISPKAVVFPSVGQEIKREDPICWIVVDGTALQVRAPVDGEIYHINTALLENPQEICDHALSSGWLVQIRTLAALPSLPSLSTRERIQGEYDFERATFNTMLTEALQHAAPPAVTFQDGGLPLHSIPRGLSSKQYYDLLKTAFKL